MRVRAFAVVVAIALTSGAEVCAQQSEPEATTQDTQEPQRQAQSGPVVLVDQSSPDNHQPNSAGEKDAPKDGWAIAKEKLFDPVTWFTLLLLFVAIGEYRLNKKTLRHSKVVERAWVAVEKVTVELGPEVSTSPTTTGRATVTLKNHGILPATSVVLTFTDVIAPESPLAPPDDAIRTRAFASPVIAPSASQVNTLPITYSKDLRNPTFIKVVVTYKSGSGRGETKWCRVVLTADTLLPTQDHNDMT